MGNVFPDICVCKEREGKDTHKNLVRSIISDSKVKVYDYTGIIYSADSLKEAISYGKHYTIYEITCVRDSEADLDHSIVKAKCFNVDTCFGIYAKILYLSLGRFIVYIYPLWQEEENGALEFMYRKKEYKVKSI